MKTMRSSIAGFRMQNFPSGDQFLGSSSLEAPNADRRVFINNSEIDDTLRCKSF